MQNLVALALVVLTFSAACAADLSTLKFGGERIGLPPLSLAERLAQPAQHTPPQGFGAGLPRFTNDSEPPSISPLLVPRGTPSLKQLEAARSSATPRVSRSYGMPIVEPRDAIDYKLTIVPPDPTIDFKLAIKHPAPADPAPVK